MTDTAPPRLTLRQRWHRLRTSPRFPFVLFFGLLVAGGLSQVYCYWWGVRIDCMAARHEGRVDRYSVFPYSFQRSIGTWYRYLKPLEPIDSVSLSPTSSIPASDLALLNGLWSLSGLQVEGPVESDGWRQIGRLRNLRYIYANGPSLVVRDRDLEQLGHLPKLNSLTLGGLSVEHRGLRHFARNSSLRRLSVHYASAGEGSVAADSAENSDPRSRGPTELELAGLREFATNRTLQSLSLWSPDFCDEHLLALTSAPSDGTEPLPSLTSLQLSRTGVTGRGVKFLSNLPRLKEVELFGTNLGEGALRGLRHNSTIQLLNVGEAQIGESDVETLLTMPRLKKVNLAYSSITEESLIRLARTPMLRTLTVGIDVPEPTVLALRAYVSCPVFERRIRTLPTTTTAP
jgi:hypothetical protein